MFVRGTWQAPARAMPVIVRVGLFMGWLLLGWSRHSQTRPLARPLKPCASFELPQRCHPKHNLTLAGLFPGRNLTFVVRFEVPCRAAARTTPMAYQLLQLAEASA